MGAPSMDGNAVRPARSGESGHSGERPADDERVDLARALEGVDGFGIREERATSCSSRMPLPPTSPARGRRTRGRQRGHSFGCGVSSASRRRRPVGWRADDERERRGDVGEHAGELLLHQLEAADRPAELLARAGRRRSRRECAGLHARRDPGDVGRRRERPVDVAPRIDALEPGCLRHAHALEGDVRVVHLPRRDLASNARGGPRQPRGTRKARTCSPSVSRATTTRMSEIVALPTQRLRRRSPSRPRCSGGRQAARDVGPVIGFGEGEAPLSRRPGAGVRGAICSGQPPSVIACGRSRTEPCRASTPRHQPARSKSRSPRRGARSSSPVSRRVPSDAVRRARRGRRRGASPSPTLREERADARPGTSAAARARSRGGAEVLREAVGIGGIHDGSQLEAAAGARRCPS